MPLTYLELENFKSYAGTHRIGPFGRFTAVIGPNGSGKSNLMDAMSFVLGVQSRDLRSQQLKDLIFRQPGDGGGGSSSRRGRSLAASCTLVYTVDEQDEQDNESSHTAGTELRFTRRISPAGVGEYLFNGKGCSFAEYQEYLADINVLVQARNFLVFQGDVEALARKSPAELVTLFETISGSIEYKKDYEGLAAEVETAEEDVIKAMRKQKTLRSERKLLKDQKQEADRFHELLQAKARTQTEQFMWMLYHLDRDRVAREEGLQDLQQELAEQKQRESATATAWKDAKKAASMARRLTSEQEKKRVQLAANVDQLEPNLLEVGEEIKTLQNKLKQGDKQLVKKRKEAASHDDHVQTMTDEIAECKQQEEQLETEYDAFKQAATDVQLTTAQEQELERLQQAAAAASANARREVRATSRKLEDQRAKAATNAQEVEEARKSRTTLIKDVKDLVERKDKLEKSLEKTGTDLKSTEKELVSVQKQVRDEKVRAAELDADIEKAQAKLREAKSDRHHNKDEERLLKAISVLQDHFEGVHGRLADLCRPSSRKFNLAVTVAGGKDMDAIVVDTQKVGFECIKYLRDNKIGTATFLPLDNLQVPSEDNLQRIKTMIGDDSRYRLVSDVIMCDDKFDRAVQYAVGSTVVADDLTSARALCFGRKRGDAQDQVRVKAVTLGGAVISKAGTMTGGVTSDDKNRAGRWSEHDVAKVRKELAKFEEERERLGSNGRGDGTLARKIEELRNNLGGLRNRDQYSKSDLEFTKKQLLEKETLLSSVEKQIAKVEKQAASIEKAISKLRAAVEKGQQEVKAAEDEHLEPFRQATGLKDVNEYEKAIGQSRDEYNERKRALTERITQLEQQKVYEAKRDLDAPIKRLEGRIAERKAAVKKAKASFAEMEQSIEKAKADLEAAEEALAEASEAEKTHDTAVEESQAKYQEAQSETTRITKALASEETSLERMRAKLHETLNKARLLEIVLPKVGASQRVTASQDDTDEDMAVKGSQFSERTSRSRHTMSQSSAALPTQFSQADGSVVVRDREVADELDFSKLSSKLKQRLSDRETQLLQKEFGKKTAQLTSEIENMTPNMKAAEAFTEITDRLKRSNTDFDKAKEASTKTAQAFQKIKNKRSKRFNEAYEHISKALKTIYVDMTKSSKHPLGGNAYLSLDDTDEPYLAGLKFNAMPPMKRFRDMEQLSGGEKTVAALALLFAIHSYHPAPFFVMDEVDAALDNINLRKVSNYITQRSQTDFQCIVISLKDIFYENSEKLVGICRDVGTNSSRCLTLDLTKFSFEAEGRSSTKRTRASESSAGGERAKKRASSSGGSVVSH